MVLHNVSKWRMRENSLSFNNFIISLKKENINKKNK